MLLQCLRGDDKGLRSYTRASVSLSRETEGDERTLIHEITTHNEARERQRPARSNGLISINYQKRSFLSLGLFFPSEKERDNLFFLLVLRSGTSAHYCICTIAWRKKTS